MDEAAANITIMQGALLDVADEQQVQELLAYLQTNPVGIEKVNDQLIRMQQSEQCFLALAQDAGSHVLAMATINYLHTPIKSYGFIDAVVKQPDAPRGLGKQVVEAVLGHAFDVQNVDMVMLTSGPERAAARLLYGNLGFAQKDTGVFMLPAAAWRSHVS